MFLNKLFKNKNTYVFKSKNDIPKEWLNTNFYKENEIVPLPNTYIPPKNQTGVTTYAIPIAVGTGYFVPGVGEVLILATGAIVVAGVTVKAGSYLYNKITVYFAEKSYQDAKKKGTKTENHSTQSTSTKSSLPIKGKARSSKDLKDSKGVKQRRYYDKNGNADVDIDYRHAAQPGVKFPHRHTWINGKRSGH
ncbi:hypothetical protein [Macrococcus bovicus]|uniref:Uncharacterized protein n=1 Tax=Macrococcus bovicus TaxID=69968 RepID=A0A4R6C214_9STAP|nr:hypothetical protein [Macrococcus bovicus]TDM15327.1 hypothetical protein ERX55_00005 [Macrococcus bovicus]